MRIVIDTNVFISGIFWEGNYSSKIINDWKMGKFELVCSRSILQEIISTFKNFKIRLPENIIEEWKRLLTDNSLMVEPSFKLDVVEDSDDNKFVEAATEGDADYIITQDKHLLKVKEYNGVKIITPKEFIHRK